MSRLGANFDTPYGIGAGPGEISRSGHRDIQRQYVGEKKCSWVACKAQSYAASFLKQVWLTSVAHLALSLPAVDRVNLGTHETGYQDAWTQRHVAG